MPNPTEEYGLNTVTFTDPVQITTLPVDEAKDVVVVKMAAVTATMTKGQLLSQAIVSSSPVCSPIATVAAFTGATSPVFVLYEDASVVAASPCTVKVLKTGRLNQEKLTPSTIPVGTYYNGQFTIEKESN